MNSDGIKDGTNQVRTVQVGTFIKFGSPQVVEVLATTALDFVVVDAEHAPFDRGTIDLMMLAGRAAALPVFVRIPNTDPSTILSVLDCGAAGILVPHIDTPEQARETVARARYRGGVRGYSGSPRFAAYGTLGMKQALKAGDETMIICQIESFGALESAAQIAAVPGVDGLFIGRADLALSLGEESSRSELVLSATRRIIAAALSAGKIAAMFVSDRAERDEFSAQGVTWFVVGSDQSLLRQAAQIVANPMDSEKQAASNRTPVPLVRPVRN